MTRALHAGAAGYWMENGSAEELLRAVETVAGGKIYVSPLIASLALDNRSKLCLRTRQFTSEVDLPLELIHRELIEMN
jgi:DNA-binding NarL/FixJ family response regulator